MNTKRIITAAAVCLLLLFALTAAACRTPDGRDPETDVTTVTDAPGGETDTPTEPAVTEAPTEPETEGIRFENVVIEEETRAPAPYDDSHAWVFAYPEDAEQWGGSGATITVEQRMLTVRPTTHDPILQIMLTPDKYIDASDYTFIAYRYAAETKLSSGVFFVGSTEHQAFSDNGLLFFTVNKTGEWTDLVMDMTKNPYWVDQVTKFRIDPINGSQLDEGSCIRVERVGFFRTEEDARAFLDCSVEPDYEAPTVLHGDMCKAFLPRGVWYEGADASDFLLTGTTDGAKCVSVDGKIIPLSYVNPVGYAFYRATGAGSYKAVPAPADDGTALGFLQARGMLTGKSANDELTKDDLASLMQVLTSGADTAAGCMTDVQGAAVRDLCAALDAYVRYAEFDVYKSIVRRSPILEGRCVDALKSCWSTGIITYDDLRCPDDVLTAAHAAEIVQRMIKVCLGLPVLPSGYREGRMEIGAWHSASTFTAADVKLLAESGINMIVSTGALEGSSLSRSLKMADEYGIRVLIYNYAPGDFNPYDPLSPLPSSGEFYDYTSYMGNTIYDEPGSDDYNKIGRITDYYKQVLPGKVPFYNLLPMYANAAQLKYGAGAAAIEYYDPDPELYRKYVESYAQKVDTDYICVDIYPNRSNGKAKATYDGYLRNMDIFASVCREYKRDFWLYVQTTGLDGIRVPDYDDMRWQMYVGLSFGVQKFIHFTYNTYNSSGWTVSMVGEDGRPTSVYEAAQKANLEVLALSDEYLKYRNVSAYTVNAKPNLPYMLFDNQLDSLPGLTVDTKQPVLVGCFEAKSGAGYAFTLVNLSPLTKRTASDISFTLADAHKVTVWQGGAPTVIEPVDGVYTVSLEVAEGVFVTVE